MLEEVNWSNYFVGCGTYKYFYSFLRAHSNILSQVYYCFGTSQVVLSLNAIPEQGYVRVNDNYLLMVLLSPDFPQVRDCLKTPYHPPTWIAAENHLKFIVWPTSPEANFEIHYFTTS